MKKDRRQSLKAQVTRLQDAFELNLPNLPEWLELSPLIEEAVSLEPEFPDLRQDFHELQDLFQDLHHFLQSKMSSIQSASTLFDLQHLPLSSLDPVLTNFVDLSNQFHHLNCQTIGIGERLINLQHEKDRVNQTQQLLQALAHFQTNSTSLDGPAQPLLHELYHYIKFPRIAARHLKQLLRISHQVNELQSSPESIAMIENLTSFRKHMETHLIAAFLEALDAYPTTKPFLQLAAQALIEMNRKEALLEHYLHHTIKLYFSKSLINPFTSNIRLQFQSFQQQFRQAITTTFPMIQAIFHFPKPIQQLVLERILHDKVIGLGAYVDELNQRFEKAKNRVANDILNDFSVIYQNLQHTIHEISHLPANVVPKANYTRAIHGVFANLKLSYQACEIQSAELQTHQLLTQVAFPETLVEIEQDKGLWTMQVLEKYRELVECTQVLALEEFVAIYENTGKRLQVIYSRNAKFEMEDGAKILVKVVLIVYKAFVGEYLDRVLHLAYEFLYQIDTAMSLPWEYCLILKQVIDWLDKVEAHFQAHVVPLIQPFPTQATICHEGRTSIFASVERHLGIGLQRVGSFILNCVENLLKQTQHSNDYIPASGVQTPSDACMSCCAFLEPLIQVFASSLRHSNREQMAQLLGHGFHSRFLKHFSQYRVNLDGATRVALDLEQYHTLFRAFESIEVKKLLRSLDDIPLLLQVPPPELRVHLQQLQSTLSSTQVETIIRQRLDYKQCILNS